MNDQMISALADGEKLEDGVELNFSPEMQAKWMEYHRIGDLLRAAHTEVPVLSGNFQRRFAAAFEAEPPLVRQSCGIARLTRGVRPFMHHVWSSIVHPMRA